MSKSLAPSGSHPIQRVLPIARPMLCFVIASVLDFTLTYALLWTGRFVESNPVSAFFLDSWGIEGLLAFKATAVFGVCLATAWIALHRPRVARGILVFGGLVTLGVVFYSLYLSRLAPGM